MKEKRIKDINWELKLLRKDRKDDLLDIRRLMKEKRELQSHTDGICQKCRPTTKLGDDK